MSNSVKLFLIVVLLIGGLWGENIREFVNNNIPAIAVDDAKNTTIPEPDLAYKTLVKPLQEMQVEPKDAIEIRDFFWQLSQIVQHEPKLIETTGQFRKFNIIAGGLNFAGLEMKNKYPDLGETIDSIIMDAIGKEDVALDDKRREVLFNVLHAIAWSMQ